MTHAPAGAAPEAVEAENEASCFYHPGNRATTPCDDCGRFLCNLCLLKADGRQICPACFATALRAGTLLEYQSKRTNYDTVALALTTPVLFFVWPALLSAPAALYMTFRHWKSPRGLLRKPRFRYYLAALLATAEIVGLFALAVLIVKQLPFFR